MAQLATYVAVASFCLLFLFPHSSYPTQQPMSPCHTATWLLMPLGLQTADSWDFPRAVK